MLTAGVSFGRDWVCRFGDSDRLNRGPWPPSNGKIPSPHCASEEPGICATGTWIISPSRRNAAWGMFKGLPAFSVVWGPPTTPYFSVSSVISCRLLPEMYVAWSWTFRKCIVISPPPERWRVLNNTPFGWCRIWVWGRAPLR